MNETIEFLQFIVTIVILVLVLKIAMTRSAGSIGASKSRAKQLVMDTSALIDGRILEIANAGFMPMQLVVPRFIINELQLLADGKDAHKRERARFGLDMVRALQDSAHVQVVITKEDVDPSQPTDDRLVLIAKKLSADLCTIDYNLNKVATIEGVRVLNVNELAQALRPVALPGEQKRVKIVQKGSSKNQGVGYMEDGSMVVVEDAARSIGKTVDIEISRYIQTEAGKMLFAKKRSNKAQAGKQRTQQVKSAEQLTVRQ